MFVGPEESGLKDTKGPCRAAVCSEWASCSLFILVSQCPRSQRLPRRRTDTASLQHAQRSSLLLRGAPFRGDQKAPGQLGRPYAPTGTKLLKSPQDRVPLHSTPWWDQPDLARLACGWYWALRGVLMGSGCLP